MLDASNKEIAAHVRRVLMTEWDPIDIVSLGAPKDEYDSYIPALVALTRDSTVFEDEIIAHLARIETDEMCMSLKPERRTRAARALLGLREACLHGNGKLIEQWTSADGMRCAWVFETPGGLYVYDEKTLRHEDDENGPWSCWGGTGLGRSGLYETAEAAAREARALINWLREIDLGASASVALPWRDAIQWRALDTRERAVLDRLFAADFPGRDGLSAQAQTAVVRRIDNDGSLRFQVEGAPTEVATRVPVEGRYREGDDPSGPAVNLLLHVVGGRLHELEVYKDDGSVIIRKPFEIDPEQIEASSN